MAVTVPATVMHRASSGRERCPQWCATDDALGPQAVLHRLDLDQTWGATSCPVGEEKIGLALEREDDDSGDGQPRISVQFSHDGVTIDGTADMPVWAAESLAHAILRLADDAKGDGAGQAA